MRLDVLLLCLCRLSRFTVGFVYRCDLLPQLKRPETRAQRMPEIEESVESERGEALRSSRQEELARVGSDMDVIFLGTASCIPSVTRGVSCAALRYEGKTWLFDGGEGSQVQVQKSTHVHPGRIDAIFVTHAHGDHTFGLPGLLCIIGQNNDHTPLHIYGPPGLALYLRASLQLTVSRVAAKYYVHELRGLPVVPPPGGPGVTGYSKQLDQIFFKNDGRFGLLPDQAFGELGRDEISPEPDGSYTIQVPDSTLLVKAAPMVHGVPCVGYVVLEPDKPGKLDAAKVSPIVDRNYDALKAKGIKQPKKVYQVLKNMRPGQSMTFPDGTRVHRDDVVEADRQGRVLVFCGDTADASRLLPLMAGKEPDLVIHEATNAHISPFDDHLDPRQVARLTAAHGHSTPEMAANFAFRANAKRLVLTHFSPRYKGDASVNALVVMSKIEQAAMRAWRHLLSSDSPQKTLPDDAVLAAWDLLFLPVPPPEQTSDSTSFDRNSTTHPPPPSTTAAAAATTTRPPKTSRTTTPRRRSTTTKKLSSSSPSASS